MEIGLHKIKKRFREFNLWAKILLIFLSLLLGAASWNHLKDLILHGILPYSTLYNAPMILNIYWTSLTIFDPIGIGLLLTRPRIGLWYVTVLITTNVMINSYASYPYFNLTVLNNAWLHQQMVYGILMLISTPLILLSHRNMDKRNIETSHN